MKITLSPSTLNLFKDCPRCFWLNKVKKIKRPSGPFPSLPSGMDKILKVHFDKHRKEGTKPQTLKDIPGKLYTDLNELNVWRNNFKGLEYRPNPDTLFRGAVDDMFVTSQGKYAPLDFKTRGYPLKEDTHEHYRLQMDCYALLLEKNNLPTAGFAILLFYHPKQVNPNHMVEFYAEPIKIPTDPKTAENVFQEAVACLKGKEPKANEGCGFCGWVRKS